MLSERIENLKGCIIRAQWEMRMIHCKLNSIAVPRDMYAELIAEYIANNEFAVRPINVELCGVHIVESEECD
jgi:hypothetical protein